MAEKHRPHPSGHRGLEPAADPRGDRGFTAVPRGAGRGSVPDRRREARCKGHGGPVQPPSVPWRSGGIPDRAATVLRRRTPESAFL